MRNLTFIPEDYYHVYNRGNDKRLIFVDEYDQNRFIQLLYLCNNTSNIVLRNLFPKGSAYHNFKDILKITRGEPFVDICSYCLMPNHFHLILRERNKTGISTFMHKLSTAYTLYFNNRHGKSGSLFQGRFKAEHVNTDRYLKYLISYVHLNPIKLIDPQWKEAGIRDKTRSKEFLKRYTYSSYLDYLGISRPEGAILQTQSLPNYFEYQKFESFVTEWLDFNRNT